MLQEVNKFIITFQFINISSMLHEQGKIKSENASIPNLATDHCVKGPDDQCANTK